MRKLQRYQIELGSWTLLINLLVYKTVQLLSNSTCVQMTVAKGTSFQSFSLIVFPTGQSSEQDLRHSLEWTVNQIEMTRTPPPRRNIGLCKTLCRIQSRACLLWEDNQTSSRIRHESRDKRWINTQLTRRIRHPSQWLADFQHLLIRKAY